MGPDAGLFNVGEPMASRVGSTGMSAADITSVDMPLAYGLLDAVPGVATTTAWNIGRVSNTITGGGTAGRARRFGLRGGSPYNTGAFDYNYSDRRGRGGMFGMRGGGITQTLGPRHMRRLTRPANIDPSFYGAKSGIYTPFNSLAGIGNRLFSRFEGSLRGNAATRVQAMVGAAPRVEGEAMFSSGTLGRISAMGKMSSMNTKAFNKNAINMRAAIADINPTYYNNTFAPGLRGLQNSGAGDDALRYAYRSGIGSTINSRIAGRAAGYIQGAEAAYSGRAALHGALSTATGHFRDGLHVGAKAAVGPNATSLGKFVGKGYATGILRGASTAGWIMLAHDVALGVGRLAGAGIKTAFGAAQSTLGSINKGVMGMGFKDNAVAATSRQRGVMAIQNSRLNARSALGSEAAMLNAHFG